MKMIVRCISLVSYSIRINGVLGKSFIPTRGLRQGDPLSPFLFLIVSEALTGLLNMATDKKNKTGVKIGKRGPRITHLFFTDDSMILEEPGDEMLPF